MTRVILAWLLLLLPTAHGQVEVGNGGDAVRCRPEAGSVFSGYYSLDYLLTWGTSFGSQDAVPVASWDESASRLRTLLATKAPALLFTFDDFRLTLRNTDVFWLSRVWEPAPFGLVDLRDEHMVSLVPANCRDGDVVSIVQAVIRQDTGTSSANIVYRFVPSVVDEMNGNSPVQLSFLYVHEWLWDVSDNVDRNRRINAFLHSERAAAMSAATFDGQLRGMGVDMPILDDPFRLTCTSPRYPDLLDVTVFPQFSPRTRHFLQFRHTDASGVRDRSAVATYNGPNGVDIFGVFMGSVAGSNDGILIQRHANGRYSIGLSPVGLDDIIDFTCDRR